MTTYTSLYFFIASNRIIKEAAKVAIKAVISFLRMRKEKEATSLKEVVFWCVILGVVLEEVASQSSQKSVHHPREE
jgi:hypothetical protein